MSSLTPNGPAPVPAPASFAAPTICKNCAASVADSYCPKCGQAANVHVLSTAELVHELLEGLTHSDSRLWRSLKTLWFNPGRLTQEFVAGRRMHYLPPFRLYLVLSVVFFFLASASPVRERMVQFDEPTSAAQPKMTGCDDIQFEGLKQHPVLAERIHRACQQIVSDNGASLVHIAWGTLYKAMFFFLPLIAALNMLLYWRPRFPYAEHVVFLVHLHATYFSAGILILAAMYAAHWPKAHGVADSVQTILGWCLALYTLIAVRRVFAKSWFGAVCKTVVLSGIYLAVFALTVAVVFAFSLLQL